MEKKQSKTRIEWLFKKILLLLMTTSLLAFSGILTSVASNQHVGMRHYNVGVLMASRLDSPFDLERAGPAVDMALEHINKHFLSHHNITLHKVQAR